MIWLPELAEAGVLPRLPLSLAVGPVLMTVLAEGAVEVRAEAARCALEFDPALSLWAALRAWRAGHDELRTVPLLARWLAEAAGDVLVWPAGAPPAPDGGGWVAEYRRLTARSLAIARQARELASGEDDTPPSEAHLIGLSHAAQAWFALDGTWCGGGAGKAAVAGPPWLMAALDRLRDPKTAETHDAVGCVSRALQGYGEATAALDEDQAAADGALSPAALSLVGRSLPELAAKLAGAARLRGEFDERLTAAKLEAMAEFAAGAGHEINNPIAVIAGRAQLLLDTEKDAQRRRDLAVINSQAMRVYEMIADMMLFARPPAPRLASCDVRAVVEEVVAGLADRAREKQVRLTLHAYPQPLLVSADANQLAVAVQALCQNALTEVDRGGQIGVHVERLPADNASGGGRAVIRVVDNGDGIAADVAEHLFDPFYCGRAAGRGLGMGLAKAWRIVRNHGGQITAENQPVGGAVCTITLDCDEPACRSSLSIQ